MENVKVELEDIKRCVRELTRDARCLHKSFVAFERKYAATLDTIITERKRRSQIADDIIGGTIKSLLWALILCLLGILIYATKAYLAGNISI